MVDMKKTKVAFVTHFCPHYRVKTFERLAQLYDVEYFFYSPGNEWYRQGNHGVRRGKLRDTYLRRLSVDFGGPEWCHRWCSVCGEKTMQLS